MTLTLPTPDAGDTARQRFALELLLQQPVPGPEQLLASRNLLSDALPDVSPDQWRALQAMPIAIGADHLDIAIPSQWRDQEWQQLIDQLPDQHRTIRLHPAIEADLQQALANLLLNGDMSRAEAIGKASKPGELQRLIGEI